MNKQFIYHFFICLFAYLLICLLIVPPTHAQTISLGIYPPIIKITTNPPASITSPFVVKNYTDNPVDATIQLKMFTTSPENNGEVTYLDANQPIPGNDPLIFQKIQITENGHPISGLSLAPQETKTLEIHVGIPQDEPASDYYFSILFITKGIANDQSNYSAITAGIGSHVLLSIGPEGPTAGSIKKFSSPWFVAHGPVPFTVQVQNNSSHFINPKGTILIQNIFGQFIGRVSLLSVNILEHSTRFVPDDHNINLTQAIWPEKFLLGFYKAKVTIALSDTGPVMTKTLYFFAFPTIGIIILVGLCIFGTIIFVRVRKKLRQL